MIFSLSNVRSRGGLIGRDPYPEFLDATSQRLQLETGETLELENGSPLHLEGGAEGPLFDPAFNSLIACVFGYSGPTTNNQGPTNTVVESWDFSSNFNGWTGQTGSSVFLQQGKMIVSSPNPYEGAVHVVNGLTQGDTFQISGTADSVAGFAIIVWNTNTWANIIAVDHPETGLVSWSHSFQIPAGGNIRYGLVPRTANQQVAFDDVKIEKITGSGSGTLVSKDLTGRDVTWTGTISVDSVIRRKYPSSINANGGRISINLPAIALDDALFSQWIYLNGVPGAARGVLRNASNSLVVRVNSAGNWEVIDGSSHVGSAAVFNSWNLLTWGRVGELACLMAGGAPVVPLYTSTGNFAAEAWSWGATGSTFTEPMAGRFEDILVHKGFGNIDPFVPNRYPYDERARRFPSGMWGMGCLSEG